MTLAGLGATLLWAFASALIGGFVAFALNRRAVGWSLVTRVLFAIAASLSPTFGIVAFLFAAVGPISVWFSPDEFLIPFAVQLVLIVALATPVAWLVSRRGVRNPVPTDVFD